MRAFIAITVPEEVKQYAADVKRELAQTRPDIKWVEYVNYHLTLKFLGDVQVGDVDAIRHQLLQTASHCPGFTLEISGLGFFPNVRRPRVAWLGVTGEIDKADFLADRVDAYLFDLGYEAEKQRSHHLTLGRIRSDRNLKALMTRVNELDRIRKPVRFSVDKFHLMESRLSQYGPLYRIDTAFLLEG